MAIFVCSVVNGGAITLKQMKQDLQIFDLINKERDRQTSGLELIASENYVSNQVMEAMGIRSLSALDRWVRAYRGGGPDALAPRPRGRPGKASPPTYATREEELEARVRELELELEIQKRINALADGLKPR